MLRTDAAFGEHADGRASRSRRPSLLAVGSALLIVAGLAVFAFAALRATDDASRAAGGEVATGLNFSCYAFRDVNRDGVYDTADRPYAALTVEGSGPNGTLLANSNSAGFANFDVLLDGEATSLVDRPGTYSFVATAPEGWMITTDSTPRAVEFVEMTGSPTGLAPSGQCEPFGVAPLLTISGTTAVSAVSTGATVTVESSSGARLDPSVSGDSFGVPVEAGEWTVNLASDAGAESRRVLVGDVPVLLSQLNPDREAVQPLPRSVVVGFDDFTAADTLTEVPNGYAGLNWSNWVSTHRLVYAGPGYNNVGTSGEFVAYNGSGNPATVSSPEPFDFVGVNVGVAWPAAEEFAVEVRGWRAGELVYSDTIPGRTAGAVYFAADYRSIDRLEITSAANWQVVIDDAEFRLGS
ncbi:MAG: hypothetical protein HKN44_04320 [Ilumatobacter sp.]|nr:hypothetical protein [Ilumatobacter sp.]